MKTIVITPAFCKSSLLVHSLRNFYDLQTENYEHWILLNHYPVNEEKNTEEIRQIAEQYGCKVFDSEFDRGLHKSVNNFYEHNPQPEGTIQIGFDPDGAIEQLSKGFDKALSETLREGIKSHNMCLLNLYNYERQIQLDRNYPKIIINDNRVLMHPSIGVLNIGAVDLDFVKQIGGFWEKCEYYGYIELYMWEKMQQFGRTLGYLTEFKERYQAYPEDCIDPEYQQWKQAHITGFEGSFKEWLKINKPEML
jgi:hypothetical protein